MQNYTTPSIRSLETLAFEQHGYFTGPQAREHGVSRQLLHHYVQGGRFDKIRRGLYRIHGFPMSEHDDIREGWMAVGVEGALVSHESALAVMNLSDVIPDAIHLLVPRSHKSIRPPPGVILHSYLDRNPPGKIIREGMAVEAPAPAIVDSAGMLQPDQLELAIRQAIQRGIVTRRQLMEEAEGRSNGSAVTRALEAIGR